MRTISLFAVLLLGLAGLAVFNWSSVSNFLVPARELPRELRGMEMAKVEPGDYNLTILVPNSLGRKYYSKPVSIKKPFEISRHEITIDQWNACFKDGACAHKAKQRSYQKGDHPVTRVSWYDALTFTRWLSGKTDLTYRLPTEEEWAYAAFSGADVTRDTIDGLIEKRKQEKVASMALFRKTLKIGAYGQNKWAIYDTRGSVWEWTLTCWFSSDKENKKSWTIKELSNQSLCANRVVQGDERAHVPFFVDEVYTGGCGTGAPVDYIGFRVVKELS